MKKITWVHLFLTVVISSSIFVNCKDGEKKPGAVVVTPVDTLSTLPVIDTTIIEPGDAPIADNNLTKGKPDKKVKEKISCAFGFKKFNNRKRPIEEAKGGVKGKPPRPGTPPPPPPPPDEPPTTNSGGTIYLDFYGGTFTGTLWASSLTVNDAGLSQPEIDYVVTATAAHFTEYNVVVTTDESVFNATPIGRRIRIVITESWQWYGSAGGVAYLNSFLWTDNSPAFVFSLLLNYNGHNIAEAAAHEAGHTLGLRHQSDCVNGVVTNTYSAGKTMGFSYNVLMGLWVIGTSSLSCIEQNDMAKLTAIVGLK